MEAAPVSGLVWWMRGVPIWWLGSSSWISLASREPLFDPEMRTFNWVHLDPELYTPCGTMQAAGYSYQWYRNTLCRGEMEEAAKTGESLMSGSTGESWNPHRERAVFYTCLSSGGALTALESGCQRRLFGHVGDDRKT